MGQLTCCETSTWVFERDLAHTGGFDYLLGKCGRCGAAWMSVFCVASGVCGYERVTQADAEAIHSIRDDRELKAFVRRWGDTNL
jgi:hypothetical protein